MASEAKSGGCTICDKIGLKPFTKENIYYFYIPLHGMVSYGALAVNIMNPSMFSKFMLKKDITTTLLVSSLVGSAFYLYGRPHLKQVPNGRRGAYTLLGGALFSMGSVLSWAFIKSALPKDNAVLATIAGLATGAVIVKLSTDYINEIDKLVKN